MFQRLEEVEKRYYKLDEFLSDPGIINNKKEYQKIAKEYSDLSDIVSAYLEYKNILNEIKNNKELFEEDDDEEIRELARSEIHIFEEKKKEIEARLKILLLPKDPRDKKNVFLEIRAGAGGEEAALFASGLFKMYSKYSEKKGWRIELMNQNVTEIGGIKEIIALIEGDGVYSRLKYESGVHRVQRVPTTETQGRIHTSTVTVAILPEADDVEVDIDSKDLRIDVFRSSGPGGQSVNTTDSAVRVTHIPTGLVVTCQDEKSQHKNKAKAIKVLKARLLEMKTKEQESQISQERRNQVGSGERSEKIRTYNFPQGRVSDHRIGLTLYKLDYILEGDVDEIIDPLIAYYQSEALKNGSYK